MLNEEEKDFMNEMLKNAKPEASDLLKDKWKMVLTKCLEDSHQVREAAGLDFKTLEELSGLFWQWQATNNEEHLKKMMQIWAPHLRPLTGLTMKPDKTLSKTKPDGTTLLDEMGVSDGEFGDALGQIFKCFKTEDDEDIKKLLNTCVNFLERWKANTSQK